MEGVSEPVPPRLRHVLRAAALEHALSERRFTHRPLLHVGLPGRDHELLPADDGEPMDHALRTDVVAAALARARRAVPQPLAWITRTGDLVAEDVDLVWLAACRQAFAEADTPLTYVVVNRHGWRDPRSGVERHWTRLRRR